ncbi:hypothetical protein D3C79_963740 [compost metagenome]
MIQLRIVGTIAFPCQSNGIRSTITNVFVPLFERTFNVDLFTDLLFDFVFLSLSQYRMHDVTLCWLMCLLSLTNTSKTTVDLTVVFDYAIRHPRSFVLFTTFVHLLKEEIELFT